MEFPVKTRSGELFYVQVDAEAQAAPDVDTNTGPSGGQAMGRGKPLLDAAMFSKAVAVIKGVSEEVSEGLMATSPRPDEVELSLGLGFDAGGNIWLFKGGANANLRLTLKWKLPPYPESPAAGQGSSQS